MKITARAKKRWFKKHVNSFELYYYDAAFNYRLAEYNYFYGLYKDQDKYHLYCSKLIKMARELEQLSACEIFFKYKKLRFYNLNEKYRFRFYWD